jgi:hypothetical protein
MVNRRLTIGEERGEIFMGAEGGVDGRVMYVDSNAGASSGVGGRTLMEGRR